jgi:hypothetical protein
VNAGAIHALVRRVSARQVDRWCDNIVAPSVVTANAMERVSPTEQLGCWFQIPVLDGEAFGYFRQLWWNKVRGAPGNTNRRWANWS